MELNWWALVLFAVVKGQKTQIYDLHPCSFNRTCLSDPSSRMTCGYSLTLSHNYALSKHCRDCPRNPGHCSLPGCIPTDGYQRGITIVNELLPGPPIRVCQGDTVIVDVTNHLVSQGTSIHWHGIHQKGTPWMDGVPGLSNCPINPGSTYRYEFQTPLSGTHFWHSHEGLQRADGVFGGLIVRPPIEQNSDLYDLDLPEHEILLWDWLGGLALESLLRSQILNNRDFPINILVNGRGLPNKYFDNFAPEETLQTKNKSFVPLHEIRIEQNLSYRMRLISNGIVECPIELSVENHTMEVIATDGFDVRPVLVESLVIFAGERYDFILRGNQPIGSYWIKFRGLIDCERNQVYQLAVLNYGGIRAGTLPSHSIKTWQDSAPNGNVANGIQLNPVNIAPGVPGKFVILTDLFSMEDNDPEILTKKPDHQFYFSYDFNPVRNFIPYNIFGHSPPGHLNKVGNLNSNEKVDDIFHYLPQLNFISHIMPHSPPLSEPETIPLIDKCNNETRSNCSQEHCRCSHWINVNLNSIVEFVVVDRGFIFDAAHPFHLHGHSFRVVAMERFPRGVTDPDFVRGRDNQGLIQRRISNAPIKDTVYIPDGGYTIIRFRADNPGFWLFHCHVEFHAEEGMSLILQVGELNEMPRPPRDFLKCPNYLPPPTSAQPISRL